MHIHIAATEKIRVLFRWWLLAWSARFDLKTCIFISARGLSFFSWRSLAYHRWQPTFKPVTEFNSPDCKLEPEYGQAGEYIIWNVKLLWPTLTLWWIICDNDTWFIIWIGTQTHTHTTHEPSDLLPCHKILAGLAPWSMHGDGYPKDLSSSHFIDEIPDVLPAYFKGRQNDGLDGWGLTGAASGIN